MKEFVQLYKAGRVKRYHTADVPAQELGQHSWGVAMIVRAIYPNHNPPSYLLLAALTHDLAESVTGDVPAPAKWASPKLNEALEEMEAKFNADMCLHYDLTFKEKKILEWADTFELCLYCCHHSDAYNWEASQILKAGLEVLSQMGFPTTEAKELYEYIFG